MKPDNPLQVGQWQYLPEQDKLVQFDANGKIAVTADLDNLSQKVANYFIANAGRLITKDELLADVWGIRDVSDGRVTRVIRVLRVALGDDTREPRYIETIPKRGYRFIAPVSAVVVQEIPPEETDTDSDQPQQNVPSSTSKRLLWLAMAFLVTLAGVSWLFWPDTMPDSAEQAIPLLRYTPITSLDGLEFYHNVSEDERYLVYSYASPENENVTVLMLEDLQEHRRIQITEDSYSSFGAAFSPDGKQIAYHRGYPDGRCSIRIVNYNQASLEIISDTELSTCGENSLSSRLTWSPDAKYVIYPSMSDNRQMALMMKPVLGGEAEQLTKPPPSSFGDYAARFSFKGDKLAFLRGSGSSAQLWLLNLVNREIKLLVDVSGTMPGNVGWSSDDENIIYSSTLTALSSFNLNTGTSSIVAYMDNSTREVQTLKNGKLYATVGDYSHINIKEVANDLSEKSSLNKVVFSSNRNESHAEAHPTRDDQVAVVSRRSGLPQVWLFDSNGDQRQLTFFEKNERIRSLVYSPDGNSLIAQLDNDIWLLSETGALSKLPLENNVITSLPSWGGSGEYIYYAESINGRWQIARYDILEQRIDDKPFILDAELYLESYDGKYSFWRDAINKKFYLKHLDSGIVEETPITLPENQLWYKFQQRTEGIYFVKLIEDIYFKLQYYDFETREILDVLDETTLYHPRFSVSADGKRIYILESMRGDLDIARLQLP
ncbi:winged helix-turn-helix domain-containing protein [Rheinheimera baltica]|uniref:Winged helix-turn-helix domain-containing protein n=1 Tax=Rheinheimera baltica TaxID=67576 RepID=A0ABT9HXZ4_9GAMM|nr:winged helix-turn-helix domain-containing protein [Rheinheimera baltica]MDP5135998.1 winged helix-turn-helix domain-containing protein [Rheinheimera baltica]